MKTSWYWKDMFSYLSWELTCFSRILSPQKNQINHLLERRTPKLQGANALRMQVMRRDHIQKIWDSLNLAGTFADLAGKTKIWKWRNLEGKKYIYLILMNENIIEKNINILKYNSRIKSSRSLRFWGAIISFYILYSFQNNLRLTK